MGWFWNSPSASLPNAGSGIPSAPSQQQQPTKGPAAPPPVDQTPDQVEVQKFLEQFMEQTNVERSPPPLPSPPTQQATATTTPSSSPSSLFGWLPWGSKSAPESQQTWPSQTEAAPPLPPKGRSAVSRQMSEHSLPTTMSCRDAFDYAWHCHTPGSQWNSVYRDGGVRNCTELWDDFWFCMRTKNYTAENRAVAIKAHYRTKEEAKYGGGKPSSEDVWESREERVPVGSVFKAEFAPPVVDDQQYRINEMERRRRIRRELGIEDGENDNNGKR